MPTFTHNMPTCIHNIPTCDMNIQHAVAPCLVQPDHAKVAPGKTVRGNRCRHNVAHLAYLAWMLGEKRNLLSEPSLRGSYLVGIVQIHSNGTYILFHCELLNSCCRPDSYLHWSHETIHKYPYLSVTHCTRQGDMVFCK